MLDSELVHELLFLVILAMLMIILGVSKRLPRRSASKDNTEIQRHDKEQSNRMRQTRAERAMPIRMSKKSLWIGVAGTSLFVLLLVTTVAFPNESVTWWVVLGFALFVAMGLYLIVAYVNIRIIPEEDHFIYRSTFRKIHKVRYDSIERYKITGQNIYLYTDKRKYRFEREVFVGIEDFRKELEMRVGKHKKR